ncbi:hypothetical protein ACFY84_29135 [Streptomyces sp. NPDC012438]|uniref:hypothetical protein n=1 Tax=Streptomyces sp. NPDC012438 TaxID=3364833 RepID=UPI0036E12C56
MTTPPSDCHRVERFKAAGKVQNFRVPDGVSSLDARIWGSGGGGDLGGRGGFTSGVVTVTPGETLKVVVGSLTFGDGAKKGGGLSGLYRNGPSNIPAPSLHQAQGPGPRASDRLVLCPGGAPERRAETFGLPGLIRDTARERSRGAVRT